MIDLVLTLIGPDHPGIVDSLSEVIAANGGNWTESRMAQFAGKFAGILCVEVDDAQAEALEGALRRLESSGLTIVIERTAPAEPVPHHTIELELTGLDRPGLVHEVSALLATFGINMEELETDRRAAAHSGDRMFHAQLRAEVPKDTDLNEVRHGLERLAGDLMVELRLAESLGH